MLINKNKIKYLLYFFLLSIQLGCASKKKQNVLFLVVDDLRPELGAYGSKIVQSPNIDRLASKGAVFKRAFAQVPVCGPSRVSLLTGLRIGKSKYNLTTAKLNRPFTSMPRYFKKHGYYTVSLGKVFHKMSDRSQDWSEAPWRSEAVYFGKKDWAHYDSYHLWQNKESANYINSNTKRGPYYESAKVADDAYQDGKLAKKAIKKLKQLKSQDKPFFLALGFWRPHLPLNAPKKYWDLYDSTQISMADNRFRPRGLPDEVTNSREIVSYGRTKGWPNDPNFHRKTRHAYYACVSYVDKQIGKVLRELDALHLKKNTIIVLLGDHGWHLGEHNFWGKHNLLYNATHAPLIIKVPGYKHKSVNNIVEFLDIYPTLSDLTGLTPPKSLNGKSFKNLIDDKKSNDKWRNRAYVSWKAGQNVITDNYSYTEWTNSKSSMLFDHNLDPEENKNVVKDPRYKSVVNQLSSYLHLKFKNDFNK